VVRAVPLLASDDLRATAAFYRRLGFTNKGAPPDEWDYLIVEFGMRAFTMFDPYGNEIRVGQPAR
jgi:hypothetical protein